MTARDQPAVLALAARCEGQMASEHRPAAFLCVVARMAALEPDADDRKRAIELGDDEGAFRAV